MSCQQLILLTALVADNWSEASLTRKTRPNTNDKTIYSFLLYHHSDFTLMMRDSRWGCISCQHGGSDSTAIKRRQQQLGRMADFLPSVTFSVFDL